MSHTPIPPLPFIEQYLEFDSIDSTNTYAKTHTPLPKTGFCVIRAKTQSGGRGRHDARFFSAVEGGLWVSIIVPIDDIKNHFVYNRALSLAIVEALTPLAPSAEVRIKWPNDIYWNQKKICGILLESHPASANHLIIGFGCNCTIPKEAFPDDLKNIATSVFEETGKNVDLNKMLFSICDDFYKNLDVDIQKIHSKYVTYLYKTGAAVVAGGVSGILESVGPEGVLYVRTTNNELVSVVSGSLVFV